MKTIQNIVDGRSVDGNGIDIQDIDPSNGAAIAVLQEADSGQVEEAVDVAKRTFESGIWSDVSLEDRQKVLRNAANAIREASSKIVDLQIAEAGVIEASVRGQLAIGANWFDYFADFLTTASGHVHSQTPGATTIVEQEPIGVCGLFSPWNVPVALSTVKLAPALAAGNSVVWKPSEMTPMVTNLIAELIHKAGLPNGVLNLVNGRGESTGAALAASNGVDMISFTGGHLGGAAVATAAASRNIPCVTELGGKSATIIFEDADLEKAVPGAVMSAYANNGEACLVGSRILVHEPVAEELIERFEKFAKNLKVGDPREEGVMIGPMISSSHRDRVASFYDRSNGETIFGGHVHGEGFFISPGAVNVSSTQCRLWREEVFGPVVAFKTFTNEEEAIALANDSDHGLAGYIWTRDIGRAMRISKSVRAGSLMINTVFQRELNAPFGGYKASGVGREGGEYSWRNYTQSKSTVISHE